MGSSGVGGAARPLCVVWLLLSGMAWRPRADLVEAGQAPAADEAPPPSVLAEEIEEDQEKAKDEERQAESTDKRWSVRIRTTAEWDTNAPVTPTSTARKSGERQDLKLVLDAALRYRLLEGEKSEFGVGYNYYQDFYTTHDRLELIGHSGNLYYKLDAAPLTWYVRYGFSHYSVNTATFLRRHDLSPSVFWAQGNRLAALGQVSVKKIEFLDAPDLDGEEYTILWRQFWLLGAERKGHVSLGYEWSHVAADASFQRYNEHRASAGFSHPIPFDLTFGAELEFIMQNYVHADLVAGTSRHDERRVLRLSLARELSDSAALQLEFVGIDNDSNFEWEEYRRNITSLSLTVRY